MGPNYGELFIAAIGFVLTRFVVLIVLQYQQSPAQFVLSGGLALLFGLVITVLGIGLTVSTLPQSAANAVATWTFIGVLGTGSHVRLGIGYGCFCGLLLPD